MRRSSILVALVPVAAFAAITFGGTRQAHAGPTLDLDLNLGTALQTRGAYQATRVDFSLGGGAGLGYRFNIPGSWLYLQPELGVHYMRFGFNSQNLGYDFAFNVNGGLKAGLQGIVQPNIFAHLGFGYLGYAVDALGDTKGYIGPGLDVGAGLDFRLVPGFTLGVNIAYNSVLVPGANSVGSTYTVDAAKWVSFGMKAGFQFGEPRPRPVYVRRVYY